MTPLINGTSHSWADIVVNLLGVPLAGIVAVKYDDKQDKENNYGAGNMPVSRGRGRIQCTASITLASEEILSLQKAAPNKRIQEIASFDIVVSYIPLNSLSITTDILKNCEFKSNARDVKEGDMKVQTELELIVSHIVWDA
jgi:hypothetical protein